MNLVARVTEKQFFFVRILSSLRMPIALDSFISLFSDLQDFRGKPHYLLMLLTAIRVTPQVI